MAQDYLRSTTRNSSSATTSSRGPPSATLQVLIRHGHADLARAAIERWASQPEKARLNSADFEVIAMAIASNSYSNAGAWLESLPAASSRNEADLSFAMAWLQDDAP